MIELSFKDFYDQNYDDVGYSLYVMKNGLGDILYIGISTRDVWWRWFSGVGHVPWSGTMLYGNSPVGEKIVDHFPDSWDWKIQLWTLKDCIKFCQNELTVTTHQPDIKFLEPFMIQKLSPILNGSCNLRPGKDTTPKSKKEIEREQYLDQMYKEIFDKEK